MIYYRERIKISQRNRCIGQSLGGLHMWRICYPLPWCQDAEPSQYCYGTICREYCHPGKLTQASVFKGFIGAPLHSHNSPSCWTQSPSDLNLHHKSHGWLSQMLAPTINKDTPITYDKDCLPGAESKARAPSGESQFPTTQDWHISDGPNSNSLESELSTHLYTDRNIGKETSFHKETIKSRVTKCKVTSSSCILSTGDSISWFVMVYPWITHLRSQLVF